MVNATTNTTSTPSTTNGEPLLTLANARLPRTPRQSLEHVLAVAHKALDLSLIHI